jgi:hypothetical protein
MRHELVRVRDEWRRRVLAEYNSAAVTHALVGWLIELGASPTLLHEGVRIIDDELVHAELAFQVLREAGGAEAIELAGVRAIAREIELDLLGNVCALGTRVFCLGETVAVRLFSRLRAGASVAVVRAALDRVLVDEVRHRDFGWLLLEWLAQRGEWPRLRALIEQRLPDWFGEQRRHYADLPHTHPFDEGLRAWGMMPNGEYREAVFETLERDYAPRFADYGIDARAAFRC